MDWWSVHQTLYQHRQDTEPQGNMMSRNFTSYCLVAHMMTTKKMAFLSHIWDGKKTFFFLSKVNFIAYYLVDKKRQNDPTFAI